MATPPPVSVAEPSPSADPRLSTARPVPRLVVRPGARLVAAIRDQDYYVHPEPVPDLRLARLRRAASGRSFGFEVRVFEQHAEGAMAGGFHVERAGEIVAAALALQLEAMGFQVGLDLTRALAPLRDEMGSRFVIDLDRLAVRATFSGSVRFVVAHAQTSGGYSTGADLRVAVDVSDRAGSVIYSREIAESASAEAKGLEGAAERGRATAAAALSAFVRAFFGDPRLEQSLVELVRRGRQESR